MSREVEFLSHSSGCFLCGDENTCGVRARFFVEGNSIRARLTLPQHFNGYKNIAHGGVLAGLLDETMGWAATIFGKKELFYLTGELIPVGEEIEIKSHLIEDGGRIAYSEGELLHHSKVCARAKGKFIPLSREATAEVIPYLKFDQCRKYRTLFDELKKGK